MAQNDSKAISLNKLITVLDIYGSEPRRWPEIERPGLLRLIDKDADAAARFKEAQALDELLAEAPELDRNRRIALIDRIVLASASTVQLSAAEAAPSAGVVSELKDAAPAETQHHDDRAVALTVVPRRGLWQDWTWAAAAMAASLAVGVMIGQSSIADPAAEALLGNEEMANDTGSTAQQYALFEYSDNVLDEDFL